MHREGHWKMALMATMTNRPPRSFTLHCAHLPPTDILCEYGMLIFKVPQISLTTLKGLSVLDQMSAV
ncbi:hypothetical protein EMPG_17364 [Blastomyces silverae]|uniref:Uncharacterized protein n=1 Tax=Blastomyces silverae TaxID=2060906 RepID=A0A0H1B6X3_9EURO|nr:hypothetical protein EMPG_17364 [Blastomyces silverae]